MTRDDAGVAVRTLHTAGVVALCWLRWDQRIRCGVSPRLGRMAGAIAATRRILAHVRAPARAHRQRAATHMASMNEKDYYAILEVEVGASKQEVQRAFQRKARKLHPDVNKAPDAEERFKEVSEAYAVLSDTNKRARYDAMRSGSPFAASSSPSAQGGYGSAGADPFGWGFPFGGMGGYERRSASRRSRAYNPRAGSDVTYQLDIDAAQAKAGCRRGVTYQRYVVCEVCHGSGSVHADHAKTCPTCGGSGHISVDLASLFGIGVMNMVCPECEGTGRVVADPCKACGGTGRVLSASEVIVDIPADSHDGTIIRVAGMGNAGTNGSTTGDFVCRVGVPTERLGQRQAHGFEMIGFALPFLLVGLVLNVFSQLALIIVVPLAVGVWMASRDGALFHHGSIWWKNAGKHLANGALNGFTVAVFVVLMVSCMSGLGTSGRTSFTGLSV